MAKFNLKGVWLPNLPYIPNIVVFYNNKNYISLNFVFATDTPPDIDTTNWSLLLDIIEPI